MIPNFRRIDNPADTQEPYFAQIRRLIAQIITGSHKSRNAMFMNRAGGASQWLGPESVMPHVNNADESLSGGFQEGHSQATMDGGPPITTAP